MFSSLLHSYWPINCLYTCLSAANLLLLYHRSQSAAAHRFGWNNELECFKSLLYISAGQ